MTYQKNVEKSQSLEIYIGKGPIYQDLSMEINWKWPLKSWVHLARTKSIIGTLGLQAYGNRLLSRNSNNSSAKTQLLQQIRWTEPRETTQCVEQPWSPRLPMHQCHWDHHLSPGSCRHEAINKLTAITELQHTGFWKVEEYLMDMLLLKISPM